MQNYQNSSTLNPSILQEIDDMGGDISRAARVLGLDYHALKARLGVGNRAINITIAPEPEDFRDLAPAKVRRYAIAAKRSTGEWPKRFEQVIAAARICYDAGTHEMAQSTRDGWSVLYLIPRLVPAKPRSYFATMEQW